MIDNQNTDPTKIKSIPIALDGDNGRRRGLRCESRLLRSVKERSKLWPKWLLGVRRATPKEDEQGLDVIVYLAEIGKRGVQIKSSKKHAQRFRAKHKGDEIVIPVMLVNENEKESTLFLRFLDVIKEMLANERDREQIKADR